MRSPGDVLVFLLAAVMAAVLLGAFIRLLLHDFTQPVVPAYKDPAWTPQQTEVLDRALLEAERLTHEAHLVP